MSSQSRNALGRASVGADAQDLLPGGGAAVVSAAQTSEQVPDQVAVQHLAPDRIRLRGQETGERAFETDEFLVAFGERTHGDQRQAQVLQDLAFRPVRRTPRGSAACARRQGRPGPRRWAVW